MKIPHSFWKKTLELDERTWAKSFQKSCLELSIQIKYLMVLSHVTVF